MTGMCRFCRCTFVRPCPGIPCAWADSSESLCTGCVDIDRAWARLPRRAPNMRRAFARGFMAATGDDRVDSAAVGNPYDTAGPTAAWWDVGVLAGLASLQSRTPDVSRRMFSARHL